MFDRIQAITIKGHCKMMSLGMRHSKVSKTFILKRASEITGKTYKRGQHGVAAADLQEMIDAPDV